LICIILIDSKEDNNVPASMLVVCSDETLGRSILYRCELEACVKTRYKCELDLDNNYSNINGIKLFSLIHSNNDNNELHQLTLILLTSRVNNQSSLLLSSSINGITNYENNSQLFIENEFTIGFFSLNKRFQLQITPCSINFIDINSTLRSSFSNNIYEDIISSIKLTPISKEVSNLSIIHASLCGIYIIVVIENTNTITILTSPNDELSNINNIIKSTIIKGTFNINSSSSISSINSYSWIGHHPSIMKSLVSISIWNSNVIEIHEISELGSKSLKFDICLNLKIPHSVNSTTVFHNIHFFPIQLEDENKDIQIIDCICSSLDGNIIIFRLTNSVINLNNPWTYSMIKSIVIEDGIIGIEKLNTVNNSKISSENGFYINSLNCDYLLFRSCDDDDDKDHCILDSIDSKWKLTSIASSRRGLRSQIISISSNSIPNSNISNNNFNNESTSTIRNHQSVSWLESIYDDTSNITSTMLCFGYLDINCKSRVQVGVSIPGLVKDLLIDKYNHNKVIISWFELENLLNVSSLRSGICIFDSISLQCLWKYSLISSNLKKLVGVTECLSHSRFNCNHESSNLVNLAIITVSEIDSNSNITIVQLSDEDNGGIISENKENKKLKLNIIGNKLINEEIISYSPLILDFKSLLAIATGNRLLIIGWIEEIKKDKEIVLSINVLSSLSFNFSHIIEIISNNNNNKYLDIKNNNSDFFFVSIIDVGIEIIRVNSSYSKEIEIKVLIRF
jgi:hypothetical protein